MKKTGNSHFKSLLWICFLLCAPTAVFAFEDVKVEATVSESQVYEGERISLKIEVISSGSRNITRPTMPSIHGFRYLSTFPSTSTSYSNINGVASMTYTFTWQLEATREGVHQVPPITLAIGEETYKTRAITLTVLDASDRASDEDLASRPDVFLEMQVSDTRPVRGQQIVAELVIYFKSEMDLSSYQVAQGWVTEGFWQEDLNEHHSARAETVMLDGVRYRRAVLRKHALFPTRSGELTLQPYRIQANIRNNTRSGYSNDFFSGFRSNTRNMNLASGEVTISVQNLPDPPDGHFINAVGKLNVDRTLSNNKITLGESVEIVTEVSGHGNIALVSRPQYDIPGEFDVYRPQETTQLDKRQGRVGGKKVFRDVIIGRKVGSYQIPETRVAVYNDERHRYETVTLPSLAVEVVRDPNAQIGYVGSTRFNVTPVTGMVRWATGESTPLYTRWWIWVGLVLPLMIAAVAYRIRKHQERMKQDALFSRQQLAAGKASRCLQSARDALGSDPKTPYTYIHQALSGFITDRTGNSPSGHSDEKLAEFVATYANEDIASEVLPLLTKCSTIRFAPAGNTEDVLSDIREAENLIERLNKHL